MSKFLSSGALLKCSFGAVPSVFTALPLPGMPQTQQTLHSASILQIIPMVNIKPFGMCKAPTNPAVIAATAAAKVFTQAPCMPVIPAHWAPPSVVGKGWGVPMATTDSRCLCAWAGVISVSRDTAGETTTK